MACDYYSAAAWHILISTYPNCNKDNAVYVDVRRLACVLYSSLLWLDVGDVLSLSHDKWHVVFYSQKIAMILVDGGGE